VLVLALAVVLAGLAGTAQHGGDPCLQAIALEPAAGQGAAEVFRATYRHCEGAATFRVVQLYVGNVVDAGEPSVNLGYEAGRFFLEDAPGDCAPGDATVLTSTYGSFDCAASSVAPMGDDLVVHWAVQFDTVAFAGIRGVFFDAKGGAGDPEPRLEWTQMGTFVVAPDAGTTSDPTSGGVDGSDDGTPADTGTSSDGADTSGTGGSTTEPEGVPATGVGQSPADAGCTCRAEPGGWPLGLVVLVALARRRARRTRR